jgi:hypothetical protein
MQKILTKVFAVFLILGMAGCAYNVPKQEVLPPIEEPVSLSADVEPIFDAQTCTNCHNGTNPSTSLNLSAGNSYESMVSNNMFDTSDASNSRIYYYPLPTGTHFKKYTAEQANIILAWIDQGALNN